MVVFAHLGTHRYTTPSNPEEECQIDLEISTAGNSKSKSRRSRRLPLSYGIFFSNTFCLFHLTFPHLPKNFSLPLLASPSLSPLSSLGSTLLLHNALVVVSSLVIVLSVFFLQIRQLVSFLTSHRALSSCLFSSNNLLLISAFQ